MARPKKELPKRKDKRYEIKRIVGYEYDGTPIYKHFYSSKGKAGCEQQYREYMISLEIARAGSQEYPETPKIRFADWATRYLETYKKADVSEETYQWSYKTNVDKHLVPFFGDCFLGEITNAQVKEFFNQKANLSESVLKKCQMLLKDIFDTAIENGLCVKNPARKIKWSSKAAQKPKIAYTEEQLAAAEEYFAFAFPDVVVALESGARPGELVGFKWTDFDFSKMTYSIDRSISKNAKGGGISVHPPKKDSYRTNPMSKLMAQTLLRLPRTSDYVFPAKGGGPQNPNTWAQKLERRMAKAHDDIGLPVLSPNELRHTFATHLKRMGVDDMIIAQLMGHRSTDVSQKHYIHLGVEDLRSAIENPVQKSSKSRQVQA